jgi:hypothetical protein
MGMDEGDNKVPKVLNISLTVKDLQTVKDAMHAAKRALQLQDQQCRYHGTNWVMSRWNSAEVWCESCKAPYYTVKALEKIQEVIG